ncbi:antitoxin Xre/MbcA/ParS toxin-binding domain-containing protein [Iodobacter sp. CM08]|uniref:type II RES/Xre toxin-antitoxin system antitoxin n=1 Tax=Iodobacter sp. CM08 TaxID=3085902 RepID=UPI00298242A0|nr:antitoxin Xre/MbcA/ParS toxin-binding domain-containing protein [Iodobacter sp. CM08]MDW5418739.1 antitoxin Xre/MbcA/ParS toxin-binding domain-containing protein [Iodobacter sp. CM08]
MENVQFKFDSLEVRPSRASIFLKRLSAMLGLKTNLRNYSELIIITRAGISPLTIERLATQEGLVRSELDWIIPQRTLSHRRSNNEPLRQDETEKVIRLASVLASAEMTFGEQKLATKWLRQPNKVLNGMAPLEAAQTESGAKLVEKMMVQINEGYFA